MLSTIHSSNWIEAVRVTRDAEQYRRLGVSFSAETDSRGLLSQLTYRRAGVSGLTVAYLLSQDPANKVTVLAKHMPGDYDIEYASPWAGANYMPYDDPHVDHQDLVQS